MVYYKHEHILNEYRENLGKYREICDYVASFLKKKVQEKQIMTFAVEQRVKSEESLIGKLQRKGDKYNNISDITDICGMRVVCYFSDDVDKVAEIIKECFEIDYKNSVDKRKLLDPSSFGYLSLHFICMMTEEKGFPKEYCGVKFELQVRSILQHAWSAIDHDLSYKAKIGIPNSIVREFARVAGLLEIADEKFIEIRDGITSYIKNVKKNVMDGVIDDTEIDIIYLYIFVTYNKDMQAYYKRIGEVTGASINQMQAENYIPQLKALGVKTIKELHEMLLANQDLAVKIAEVTIKNSGATELPYDIGLRMLCYAKLINDKYSFGQIKDFLNIGLDDEEMANEQAEGMFMLKGKLFS